MKLENKNVPGLTKINIELIPENKMLKPYEHPYAYVFRGAIMKWLHNNNPKIVHQLHDFEKIRPYSINCIMNNDIPKINFIIVCYDDEMKNIFLKKFQRKGNRILCLGEKKYIISDVLVEEKSLVDFIKHSKPVINFAIKFITPTCFNTSLGMYVLRFPLPSIFFGNLINIWNMLARSYAEINKEKVINWINAHLYINYYKMRTVKRDIGELEPLYGGIGDINCRITKLNRFFYEKVKKNLKNNSNIDFSIKNDYIENCRWIEILCKFGEYTNVGVNRTAGMGVIKYYPREHLQII
ncbi:MAG: CRISPR system precrRNA processing endoribonuclease RAMP protein Cas6 [Promethearchaeota archaeon]